MAIPSYVAEWLRSSDPSKRCAAAERLARSPSPAVFAILSDLAHAESDPGYFALLLDMLLDVFRSEAAASLETTISDGSGIKAAIAILSAVNHTVALSGAAVDIALKRKDWQVRLAAAVYLHRTGSHALPRGALQQIVADLAAQGPSMLDDQPANVIEGGEFIFDVKVAIKVANDLLQFSGPIC